MNLSSDITSLPGVGPKLGQGFARIGIEKINDLVWYPPYRYIDATQIIPIKDLSSQLNNNVVIKAEILSVKEKITARKRMKMVEARVQDGSGDIKIVWFNQPYLKNVLKLGETKVFYGKVAKDWQTNNLTLSNPLILNSGQILPVYHETSGVTSALIRRLLKPLLPHLTEIRDPLPPKIIQQFELKSRGWSLAKIHNPDVQEEILSSRRRLGFEELLFLGLQIRFLSQKNEKIAQKIPLPLEDIKQFIQALPFTLTDSQRKAAWEILNDMDSIQPMKRLLMGDVGSGKTVVGALATLAAVKAGQQVLWLAPTEVLVNQHYTGLAQLFSKTQYSVGLYTGSKKTADLIKDNIIVGTHALLEPNCKFGKIGLIIVDEQHRFGVKQRAALENLIAHTPHYLSMTATPIPRTLALTIYGDLAISTLNELPKNRLPILTSIVTNLNRSQMYAKITDEINKGRQAFIITPLIDEAEANEETESNKKSVLAEYKNLSENIFPKYNLGFIHGKMKAKDKDQIMADFKAKKIDILVATSIIEVGIDIPNATVMVIENSDSFGLAQLHQFRGRVGRGKHQSYCFLSAHNLSDKGRTRLQAMTKYESGFKLAEIDLQLRGPGSLVGLKQSGLPDLRLASLTDTLVIKQAQLATNIILKDGLSADILSEIELLAKTNHFE